MELPMTNSRFGTKVFPSCIPPPKDEVTVLSTLDARKMVPNLENQQATIIKTSDNMVTIRSPALQQAMNIHVYQNSHSFRSEMNGYSNMNLFNDDLTRLNSKIGNLKLTSTESDDRLNGQMKNLTIKEGIKSKEIFTQTMPQDSSSSQNTSKKKKKKKKQGKSGDEKEVEPVGRFIKFL